MPRKTKRVRRNKKKISYKRRNGKGKGSKGKSSKGKSSKGKSYKMRGGFSSYPYPSGSPYDAGGSNTPSGAYYELSRNGIPAGPFDPALPSNSMMQDGGQLNNAYTRGRGGGQTFSIAKAKRSSGSAKRSSAKRSSAKRSSAKRSSSKRSSSKRSTSKSKKMRGGGLSSIVSSIVPDEIVNFGRAIPAAAGHFMDKFNGNISSASSMVYPTQQPLIPQVNSGNAISPPDLKNIYNIANRAVSEI
jgi:hypothetical protein